MADIKSAFIELQRLAQSWGGSLVAASFENDVDNLKFFPESDSGISPAPFCAFLSVDFNQRIIYYDSMLFDYPGEAAGILHEMGHVFGCRELPSDSDEYDFFGWDWALAQKVGLETEWLQSVVGYVLPASADDFTEDFGNLSPEEQSDVIEERVAHARELGLIIGDEPACIRDVNMIGDLHEQDS